MSYEGPYTGTYLLTNVESWAGSSNDEHHLSNPVDTAFSRFVMYNISWDYSSGGPSARTFSVRADNFVSIGSGVYVEPTSVIGDATVSGSTVTIADQPSGSVFITYEKTPRFLRGVSEPTFSGTGVAQISIYATK